MHEGTRPARAIHGEARPEEARKLITALRAFCNDHQDDWDDYLDMLELGFNSAVQASTQRSPYELLQKKSVIGTPFA